MIQAEPEHYAIELLDACAIDRPGDFSEICEKLRLEIQERPFTSIEGALIQIGGTNSSVIAVSLSIKEPTRKRFTISHEIGHLVVPGHGLSLTCARDDIDGWKRDVLVRKEEEANRFASALLLPAKALLRFTQGRSFTIELTKLVANEFNTSLSATALRLLNLSDERCAVIWSENAVVKWFRRNERFPYFVKTGVALPSASAAGRIYAARSLEIVEQAVYAEAWCFVRENEERDSLWEESIYFPHYDSCLTILTSD